MATNAEKLTQMMSRMGQRTSTRVREDLVVELNTAIASKEMQPFIPWFLRKTTILSLPAGSTYVDLPEDFLREREEFQPYYTFGGKNFYLEKRLIGALPGYQPIGTTPEIYALDGGQFHFRPAATQDFSIHFIYYARSADEIEDDENEVTNPWLLNAFEYISAATLKNVATFHVQNMQMGEVFAALEAKYRGELYKYHESRIHENQDYYVGGASGT